MEDIKQLKKSLQMYNLVGMLVNRLNLVRPTSRSLIYLALETGGVTPRREHIINCAKQLISEHQDAVQEATPLAAGEKQLIKI
jgi:hypothetical protein